jgi:hypothetical protein
MEWFDPDGLVYIDQNIVGYLDSGRFKLEGEGCRWMYSSVHFGEIARGSRRDLLGQLALLRACMLEPELVDGGRMAGSARIFGYLDPEGLFQQYLSNVGEVPYDTSANNDLLAALFGSTQSHTTQSIPERMEENLRQLCKVIDPDELLSFPFEKLMEPAQDLVSAVLASQLNLDRIRKALGVQGITDAFENDENPLQKIWERIQSHVPGNLDAETFFGGKYFDGEELKSCSKAQAVVGAHSVLNHLGYRPDRGLSKGDAWDNILSDGRHLAHASYCGWFLTADSRLQSKAKAIFRFFDIKTKVPVLSVPPEGSVAVVRICGPA